MVVDRATRYLTLVPLSKTDGAQEVWILIEDSVFLPFGYPVVVVHDRDPRFISDYWKDTMRAHGILPHFTTAYHPQTDGLSEAFVKKMKEVVRLVSSEDEWARDLPRIQACINHSWLSSETLWGWVKANSVCPSGPCHLRQTCGGFSTSRNAR